MIRIDISDYNTQVRLRMGDKGLRFPIINPHLVKHGVGLSGLGELILQIDKALQQLQAAP